jgi:hypothetical protein
MKLVFSPIQENLNEFPIVSFILRDENLNVLGDQFKNMNTKTQSRFKQIGQYT